MKRKSPLLNFLFGKPLASKKDRVEKVGTWGGIPIFRLDALGSAAYGPEAALTMLLPVGIAGILFIGPTIICIVILIAILFFSFLQTIKAYPNGGGSYTVSKENLGTNSGLFAGIALMIDHILVVAVGISAGTGTLISILPQWQR